MSGPKNTLSLGGLFPNVEDQRIFSVLSNYLLLSQFELARSVIDEVFKLDPERIVRMLRVMCCEPIPAAWLFSKSTPSIASIVFFCAQEYERLGAFVQNEVVPTDQHQLRERITAINAFGLLDHDVLTVDVLEGRNINVQPGTESTASIAVVVELAGQKFQTHNSSLPFPRLPVWTGYYSVCDNSYREFPNVLRVPYADAELKFTIVSTVKSSLLGSLGAEAPVVLATGSVSLATLRDQTEYTILVTLTESQSEDEDNAELARTDNGRLKVGIRWSKSPDCPLPGFIAPSVHTRLRADCLIANALLNIQHRNIKTELLSEPVVAELRAKFATRPDEIAFAASVAFQPSNKRGPIKELSPQVADSLTYAYSDLAVPSQSTWTSETVFSLSDSAVGELESLCRHLPATGHSLCAQLAQHMRLILPPRQLAGAPTSEVSAAALEIIQPSATKQSQSTLTRVANTMMSGAVLGVRAMVGAPPAPEPEPQPKPVTETIDTFRLRIWARESDKLQQVYLQMVCEAVLARDWDACLNALTHFLASFAGNVAPGASGNAVSALMLLLSHTVYYESEDAAAVALGSIKRIVQGLIIADAPATDPSDKLKLSPDRLLSLLVLVFYLRNYNANLPSDASPEEVLDANRPMLLDFVGAFVHAQHPSHLTVEDPVVQRVLRDMLSLLEPGVDRHDPNSLMARQAVHAAFSNISSVPLDSLHRLSAASPPFVRKFDDGERDLMAYTSPSDSEAPFRHPFLRKAQLICSLIAADAGSPRTHQLLARLEAEMPKVHLIAEITESDFLPFFFHQYDLALSAIEAHLDEMEDEEDELRDQPLESLAITNDARAEKEKALLTKAIEAFMMEYHAFLRTTQYGFYDFPLSQALRFIAAGKLVEANLVLLPFPQLRPLAIVLGVFRAPLFSAKYNIVIQLWDARFNYPEVQLPGDIKHDMFGCGEPALVAWCSRLNHWVELIERVYPRALVTAEQQAAASYKELEDDAQLEEKKTLLIQRLCTETESVHKVLGWDMINLPMQDFLDMFESAPYYGHLGRSANHDMLLLRMAQVLIETFKLVHEAQPDEVMSEVLNQIDSALTVGMENHLNYQLATLEKMFCVIVMRRPAGPAAEAQPFYASLQTLVALLVFVRAQAEQLLESSPESPLVPRIRRLQLHLDDFHWRAKILYKHTTGGNARDMSSLGTSLTDLSPVLLRKTDWDFAVGDRAVIGAIDSSDAQTRWFRAQNAWLERRRRGQAAAAGAADEAMMVEEQLRALRPASMDSFSFVMDLAFSAVHDEQLFTGAPSEFTKLVHKAQPYIQSAPIAYAEDPHSRLMFTFWQQYLAQMSLLQTNKFHIARRLITGGASASSNASAPNDVMREMLDAFASTAKRSAPYTSALKALARVPDAAVSAWQSGGAAKLLLNLSNDADKSILRASLHELLLDSGNNAAAAASEQPEGVSGMSAATAAANAAVAALRNAVQGIPPSPISAFDAASMAISSARGRGDAYSIASSSASSQSGSTVSKKAAYAERRRREKAVAAASAAAIVLQDTAAALSKLPGAALDLHAVPDAKIRQVLTTRHQAIMSAIMPLTSVMRFTLLTKLAAPSGPAAANASASLDAMKLAVDDAASVLPELHELLPELGRWAQGRLELLQMAIASARRMERVAARDVSECAAICAKFLLDRAEIDQTALIQLACFQYERTQTLEDRRATLAMLDSRVDSSAPGAQVLTEYIVRDLLEDESLHADARLPLLLRLRDACKISELVHDCLYDCLMPHELSLVLQKVLYGNLTRTADAQASVLPACIRALPDMQALAWPPSTPVPTKDKTFLEYILGLLRIYIELSESPVTSTGESVFLSAAAKDSWVIFENSVDDDFLGAIEAQCRGGAHRAAQKLLGLYRATKSKSAIVTTRISVPTSTGVEELSVADNAQRVIDLAALADLLSTTGTARDRLNVVRHLETLSKYESHKFVHQTRALIDHLHVLSVRLLILEFTHAKLAADRVRAPAPSIPCTDAEWKWFEGALQACRALAMFPAQWQSQPRFLRFYAQPQRMVHALILECGRTKSCLQQLVALLAVADVRKQLIDQNGEDIVLRTASRILCAQDDSDDEGEDATESQCGRAFAYLLFEASVSVDAANCARAAIECVNDMSRIAGRVDGARALARRDACIDLLMWTQSRCGALPADVQHAVTLFARALRDSTSVYYQTCGIAFAETCLADSCGTSGEAAVEAFRRRLLRADRPQLAKQVAVRVQNQDSQAAEEGIRIEVANMEKRVAAERM